MLDPRDQNALTAYFSDGRAQRSISGPILDQAALYSVRPPRRVRDREALGIDTHPPHCICPVCADDVTARPTAESRDSNREDPDAFDGFMASEKRRVGQRLSLLSKLDGVAYEVLAMWFGDGGVKYDTSKEGRINALLLLTQHGRKVLRRMLKAERGGKLGAKLELTDEQRMENAVRSTQDKKALQTDLTQARVEASALWNRACHAWLRTADREGVERQLQADPERPELTGAQQRLAEMDVRGLREYGYKLARARHAQRAGVMAELPPFDDLPREALPELQQAGESADAYRARLVRAAAHGT